MTELATLEFEPGEDEDVVRIRGEIDMSNAAEVGFAIEEAVRADAKHVVIDLAGVTYLDSGGVRLFLILAGRLRSRRQQLRLRIPAGSSIRSAVEVAGLPGAIPVDAV